MKNIVSKVNRWRVAAFFGGMLCMAAALFKQEASRFVSLIPFFHYFCIMSRKYKILSQEELYFVTFTVIGWIDVFIRNEYRNIFIDSVKFCQEKKGLEVYAWCLMTSHVHMILGTNGENKLEYIIRDLKSYTSRHIRKAMEDFDKTGESRREWMLWMMKRSGIENPNNFDFQFWQQNNHPIELNSNELLDQKLEYSHMNPITAGFVDEPEHWLYSSARDYAGIKGLIDVKFID